MLLFLTFVGKMSQRKKYCSFQFTSKNHYLLHNVFLQSLFSASVVEENSFEPRVSCQLLKYQRKCSNTIVDDISFHFT